MRDELSAAYQNPKKEVQKDIVMESGEQSSVLEITFRRIKTMDRPMTTEELFGKINSILKEKGKLPDILDYCHAIGSSDPIRTYEFILGYGLTYGADEGVYLDLWIKYLEGNGKHTAAIGTYKTLYKDEDAMHTMALLLADFIIEEHSYVNENLDDFTWEGTDVHVLKDNGERLNWGYTCATMEEALKRRDELLKYYQQVIVRDNATRKEKIYKSKV